MRDFPIVATIDALGGASVVGRAINVNIQTAHNWLRNCRLPNWRVEAIKRLAEQEGVDLAEMRRKEAAARKARAARLAKRKAA